VISPATGLQSGGAASLWHLCQPDFLLGLSPLAFGLKSQLQGSGCWCWFFRLCRRWDPNVFFRLQSRWPVFICFGPRVVFYFLPTLQNWRAFLYPPAGDAPDGGQTTPHGLIHFNRNNSGFRYLIQVFDLYFLLMIINGEAARLL
jgi:hypothetical protein